MAVAIESYGAGYVSSTGDSSVTITAPSGIQDGDLLLALFMANNKSLALSGWTSAQNGTYSDVLYRVADSESGNYTFTFAGTFGYAHGIILRISGADSGAIDVSSGETETATYNSTITCSDVTSGQVGSLALWWGQIRVANKTPTVSSSTRGTEYYDQASLAAAYSLSVYYETDVGSGAQSGAVFTLSASEGSKIGNGIIIGPAAGGGATGSPLLLMDHFNGGVAL